MADRVIVHLDMDAFYAAVEQRERPELQGKPVLIGFPGSRGVISTCSYEARRFGIHSAMPSVTAMRLCPNAEWIGPRMSLYRDVSQRVFVLMQREIPVIQRVSIDEAYGDLTGLAGDLQEAEQIAARLKRAIWSDQKLTASVGVAETRFLAKVASDLDKPDGLVVIGPDDIGPVLGPLSVRVIPGVGPKLADRLALSGIHTINDIRNAEPSTLRHKLGARTAMFLERRARGEDDSSVRAVGRERQQISSERTYRPDLIDPRRIEAELLARCEGITSTLRKRDSLARTVVVKARDGAYNTITRSKTLDVPTDLAHEIYPVAQELLRRSGYMERGLRLLGVGVKDLRDRSDYSGELFPDERRVQARKLAKTADLLRDRFGRRIVRPARLFPKDSSES